MNYNNKYIYQPDHYINENYFKNSAVFSRELKENEVWFTGDEIQLEYFFKYQYNTFFKDGLSPYRTVENSTKFWKTVGGKTPRVHSGLPKLATNAFVNLLTSSGYEITINQEDITSEEDKVRLQKILDENNFEGLFQKGIAYESWAGYFFYRISYNKEVSNKPIIELIDPKDGEAIFERDRIIGYKFKTRVSSSNTEDKFIEIHEVMILDGEDLYITYEAYKVNGQGKATQLEEIPEEYQDQIIAINFLPAVLKNNTSFNSRFSDAKYGESDYTAVQPLFHMLDDSLSQMELEIRNAKAIKFLNEKLIPKDENGLSRKFDNNQDEIELLSAEMELDNFDIKKFASILQPDLRIEKYDSTIKELTAKILTTVGLSPTTVGLPGYESINSSAESQQEREKTSLRTRNKKLKLWKKLLEDLFNKVLKFDDFVNGREYKEYKVSVDFNEYINPSLESLVATLSNAVSAGIISIEDAQREYYGDERDEQELKELYIKTKIEKGIPLTVQENQWLQEKETAEKVVEIEDQGTAEEQVRQEQEKEELAEVEEEREDEEELEERDEEELEEEQE